MSEISVSFAGVRLGRGVGLLEAQGLDDYVDAEERKALRERDEKDDWTVISAADLNGANSSLSFFDGEGMRFHLPAYLTAELRGDYKWGVAYTLCQASVRGEQFALLNASQRAAVRHYLEFVADDPNYEFERADIQRSLAGYWSA